MNLREQLAKALWESRYGIVLPEFSQYDGESAWLGDSPKEWLAVADECIRQMEWARREAMDEAVELAGEEVPLTKFRVADYGHFTLAPEDWKP